MLQFSALSQSLRMSITTAMVVSVCVVDSVTIAYDGSIMGSVLEMSSYLAYFNLTTATIAVNSTAVYLGAILIAPVAGIITDRYGRLPAIAVSCFFNMLGAAISGGAQNIGMFIAGRMLVGIGMGLAQTSASAYVSETTAPHVRSLALGLYFTCWAIGGFIATGVCYGTAEIDPSNWAWRIPCILQAFAPICVLCILPFLPESPRWLIYHDRNEEGLAVLARINGTSIDDPAVQVQYHEIVDTLTFEKTTGRQIGLVETFRGAPNRKRLALALSVAPLTMLTGSNVITYYYGTMLSQAGITSTKMQMEINLVLSAWQFLVAIAGTLLAERLGRRLLCLLSVGTCTAFLYGLGGMTAGYGTSTNTSGIYATVAFMFFFMGGYSFGLTPLTSMYPPEVMSYNIRATGMALFTLSAKACGVFVTMVFPYMFNAIGWKTYIVNASWNVVFFIWVYFYWVETKDKTLEEIDELFDGIRHTDVPSLSVINSKTAQMSVVEV